VAGAPKIVAGCNRHYSDHLPSNQVVGGSNPSGRTKINDLGAKFLGAVLLAKQNSTNFPHPTQVAGLSAI
jgi:hypothetical protein